MRVLALLFCSLLIFEFNSALADTGKIVVVIDAGHGGSDVGHETSISGHQDEKHLTLKIAQFLGSYIEKYLQNVTVVYTRTSDSYVSLDDRVDKANGVNADYFLSIHCNGNENKAVHGTETHVHSMSFTKSVSLAQMIEKQFSSRAGRKSRGVKDENDLQHSLQVLKFTEMTSVLIECGFITNETEANFLNSTYGQEILASAIFRGFRECIQKEHPSITFVKPSGTSTAAASTSNATYSIQIMSSQEALDIDGSSFKKLGVPVTRIKLNTTSTYKYIYTVGSYSSREDAKTALPQIQKNGFSDAFIIKN